MKRFLRGLFWGVAGVLGLLLLVAAAWVASNWHDIEPQPVPAALALTKPQLSDEENSFDALQKITEGLVEPKDGARLRCNAKSTDCFAQWSQDLAALRAARQAYSQHGTRCDALVGERFEFEEKLPVFAGAATEMPRWEGVSVCTNWWLSGAVLAIGEKNTAQALGLLLQADRCSRALQGGARSLIGQMIALSVSHKTLQTLTSAALRERELAQALLPLTAPFPDAIAAAKRWMVYEAAFQRSIMQELVQTTRHTPPEAATVFTPITDWLANRRIGFHPHRTSHDTDVRWLRWTAQLDAGLPAAARAQTQEAQAAESQHWVPGLTWRNSVGNMIMAVGAPALTSYIARQADLDLHRELAQLAIAAQAAGIAPEQRAAWSKTQPLSADNAARLAWSADGRVLSARSWEGEFDPSAAQDPQRSTVRIEWPTTTTNTTNKP